MYVTFRSIRILPLRSASFDISKGSYTMLSRYIWHSDTWTIENEGKVIVVIFRTNSFYKLFPVWIRISQMETEGVINCGIYQEGIEENEYFTQIIKRVQKLPGVFDHQEII
jgi:nitrate reductase NapAB chaperone NapD